MAHKDRGDIMPSLRRTILLAVLFLAPHAARADIVLDLRYTMIKRIVQDISDARVYGGIHFRFDQDGGEHQGTAIGRYVVQHYLGAVHPN
jgi:hypothetical protein